MRGFVHTTSGAPGRRTDHKKSEGPRELAERHSAVIGGRARRTRRNPSVRSTRPSRSRTPLRRLRSSRPAPRSPTGRTRGPRSEPGEPRIRTADRIMGELFGLAMGVAPTEGRQVAVDRRTRPGPAGIGGPARAQGLSHQELVGRPSVEVQRPLAVAREHVMPRAAALRPEQEDTQRRRYATLHRPKREDVAGPRGKEAPVVPRPRKGRRLPLRRRTGQGNRRRVPLRLPAVRSHPAIVARLPWTWTPAPRHRGASKAREGRKSSTIM